MLALALLLQLAGPSGAVVENAVVADAVGRDEVTMDWIREALGHAYVETEVDNDGDLELHEDGSTIAWLRLDPDDNHINFFVLGMISAEADRLQVLEFVNTLNSNIIGVTFYMATDTVLLGDAYLYYGAGVTEKRLVSEYRRFRDAIRAVGRFDDRGVLGTGGGANDE
jgi:Putative bacterial sensory transduction regulator